MAFSSVFVVSNSLRLRRFKAPSVSGDDVAEWRVGCVVERVAATLKSRLPWGLRGGQDGVEPSTSHLSGERSYQLSYLAATDLARDQPPRLKKPAACDGSFNYSSDPDRTRTGGLRRDRAAL